MKKSYHPECASHVDRRFSFERRRFSYAGMIPERRCGQDRRRVISLIQHNDPYAVRAIQEKWVDCR